MKLYLAEEFQQAWQGEDPFVVVENLHGEVFRELESRKTLRFSLSEHDQKTYFVKIHRGVGWFEIIENLLRLRLPVLGARNEYQAIKQLESLHIDTMHISGYGEKGSNPATRQSFIITDELLNTISLEDYSNQWQDKKTDPLLKNALIEKLADISRKMHNNGINHRDYYLCHFLLDISNGEDSITTDNIKLFLIDLHRAQIRTTTPERWRLKDIASLYFSVMHLGVSKKDYFRFIRIYDQMPLRKSLSQNKDFWSRVEQQGQKLWQRKLRKGDAI